MNDPERGKAGFHWALAGVLVPLVGLVVGLVSWVRTTSDPSAPRSPWARRLAVLVGVDVLVLASLLYLGTQADRLAAADPRRPRFGIVLDGRTVREVLPGSAAAEAGLRKGDVLLEVEGTAIGTEEGALRALAAAGTREVPLKAWRDGQTLEIRAAARPLPRRPVDPYEVRPVEGGVRVDVRSLVGLGLVLAIAGTTWVVARRRPGPRAWRGLLFALGLFIAGSLGTAGVLRAALGGVSTVSMLLSMLGGHAGLALGGVLAGRFLRADRPAPAPGVQGPGRTLLLSVFYGLATYPRALVIVAAADLLATGTQGQPGEALRALAESLRGAGPVLLFFLAVAVVGPIAEEIVFRGFLLPRLAARLGAPAALLVSAAAFGAMHASYGPYAAVTGLLGWILGWARLRSGGLAVPVALHMGYNGLLAAIVTGSR